MVQNMVKIKIKITVKRIFAAAAALMCLRGIPSNADYVHRVLEGETLAIIAKKHGVTTDTLLGNNQYITNPDIVYEGQILVIPGSNKQAYTIKAGDTLYNISKEFGVSAGIIADINQISDFYNLAIGQTIMIPKTYTVKTGDTLYRIAVSLGVELNDLARENNITDEDNLSVGQTLFVPAILRRQEDLSNIDNYLSPRAEKFSGSFYYKGQAGQRRIALTFDDGPGRVGTERILDILKGYDIKATFFILGTNLNGKEDLLKRIAAEGHTLANHTWNHMDISKISSEALEKEITLLENKLYEITGLRTALIRPPYGKVSDANINQLKDMGYHTIIWSVDTKDWQDFDADKVLINTVPDIRDGAIILMHDYLERTALPGILPDLIETLIYQGYSFTTVDKLLGVNAYQ